MEQSRVEETKAPEWQEGREEAAAAATKGSKNGDKRRRR